MKKTLKIFLLILAFSCLSLTAFACSENSNRQNADDYVSYTLSDVTMQQRDIDTFAFKFSVDTTEDVKVYFTEKDKVLSSDTPLEVVQTKDANAGKSTFEFESDLVYCNEYYLFVVGNGKEVMLPITTPSMFPRLVKNTSGGLGGGFTFNFTQGVSWSSFCDSHGKAIYVSDSNDFTQAVALQENIAIWPDNSCDISGDAFNENKYYFAVVTAKNGLLKIISLPQCLSDFSSEKITDYAITMDEATANVTVNLTVPNMEKDNIESNLSLVVKNERGDELYQIPAEFHDQTKTATMLFESDVLKISSKWYDMCLAWKNAVIMDVPYEYNGETTTTKDKNIEIKDSKKSFSFKEYGNCLKVTFLKTNEISDYCVEHTLSIDDDNHTLRLTLKLKTGVSVPKFIITAGSDNPIASAKATELGNGQYAYTIDLNNVLSEAGRWYDLRILVDEQVVEIYKSTTMDDEYFAKTFVSGERTYSFKEYYDLMKVQFA